MIKKYVNRVVAASCWTGLVILGFLVFSGAGVAEEMLADEVSITADHREIFGMTSGEGIARKPLDAGEQILEMKAKGVTGFVQTSTRLLGFSGSRQRWVEIQMAPSDHVLAWTVMPRMVVVQGHDALYGFLSEQARWRREVWGAGETVLESAVEDRVALFVTNRRAVAFSATTGGFFSKDLPVRSQMYKIQINDTIAILHLSDRKLVFRSGLAIWADLR